jgi:hypothetical protein
MAWIACLVLWFSSAIRFRLEVDLRIASSEGKTKSSSEVDCSAARFERGLRKLNTACPPKHSIRQKIVELARP